MSILTKIRRQGGAAVVTIPPALLKMMGTEVGAQLTLAVDNGVLMASPVKTKKKRYSLAELLEGADEMAALNAQAQAWENTPRSGNEIL